MRVLIQNDKMSVGKWAALHVAKRINEKKGGKFVLGLPTGSTPLVMYKELIKLYEEGIVSFANVVTFNMDEYVGLEKSHDQSYHYFMFENFFKHIDIKTENINLLDGMATDLKAECQRYEDKIKAEGGIDLFIGGVGEDGHIAFNEPGSSLISRTRDKELTLHTREVNSRFFNNEIDAVPKLALTVGVGTILDSKEVMILSFGAKKALAMQKGIEGSISQMWTITALQLHQNSIIVIDEEAAELLTVRTFNYFKEIEHANLSCADYEKIVKEEKC